MKKLFFIAAAIIGLSGCGKALDGTLEITVDYVEQIRWASDQYAIWIEDMSGNYVNTVFVTHYSTTEQAYTDRPDCVPTWMRKADPAGMSRGQLDAVSGATPSSGKHTYSWDLRDTKGGKVAPGTYRFFVEATLAGSSIVLFSSDIGIGRKEQIVIPAPVFTQPDNPTHKDMIKSVTAVYKP